MLDSFKLALLKVLEDVQVLCREEMRWTDSEKLPHDEKSDCCSREMKKNILYKYKKTEKL